MKSHGDRLFLGYQRPLEGENEGYALLKAPQAEAMKQGYLLQGSFQLDARHLRRSSSSIPKTTTKAAVSVGKHLMTWVHLLTSLKARSIALVLWEAVEGKAFAQVLE